jgi:predicted secreted Zn-dependent protease
LGHEKLHLDITELYVRKYRQQLDRLVVNQNIKIQMNQIHEAINDALDKTQKTYDEQTNHSINVEAQRYWEAYIAEELQKLEKYKSE